MAGLLVVVISASPVFGQGTGDPACTFAKVVRNSYKNRLLRPNRSRQAQHGQRTLPRAGTRPARGTKAQRMARTARIKQAFVASTELRPMAQQLTTLRTPAAYAGVTAYAHRHTGDAAAAAYLSLGHAYLLDKRYADAVTNLQPGGQNSEVLARLCGLSGGGGRA